MYPITDIIKCLIFIDDEIINTNYDSILMDNSIVKIYIGVLSHPLEGTLPNIGHIRYPFLVVDSHNLVWMPHYF